MNSVCEFQLLYLQANISHDLFFNICHSDENVEISYLNLHFSGNYKIEELFVCMLAI